MLTTRKRISDLVEGIGLNWIPIIMGLRDSPISVQEDEQIIKSLETHQPSLDLTQTNSIIERLTQLKTETDKQQDKIESKALLLTGFGGLAGISTGVLVTTLGTGQFSNVMRWFLFLIYCLFLASVLITVLLAVKAIRGGYRTSMSSDVTNFWESDRLMEIEHRQAQAKSLLQSYLHSRGSLSNQALFLSGAQNWFRNTLILFTLLIIPIAIISWQPLSDNRPPNSAVIVVTRTPAPTPTPGVPDLIIKSFTGPRDVSIPSGQTQKTENYQLAIANIGSSTTRGAFRIVLRIVGSGSLESRVTANVNDLAAGETVNLQIDYNFTERGIFTLEAFVDSEGVVVEGNESNNIVQMDVTVQ